MQSIRGVAGCRAVLDRQGELVELHVVSTGGRPPKLITRDIQSLLLVRLNLRVHHRRISVAAIPEPAPATPSVAREEAAVYEAAPLQPPPAEEGVAARLQEALPTLTLGEVRVRYVGNELHVQVGLDLGGRRLTASVRGPDEGVLSALLGARAVMEAVAGEEAFSGAYLQWVDVAGVSSAPAVVVSLARAERGRGPSEPQYLMESVAARPERGNLTLAAASAAVEALSKLLSAHQRAV